MELGVHLPLMQFGDEPAVAARMQETVDAARECGFAAVSANDHLVFQTPWLDGPTALASIDRAVRDMDAGDDRGARRPARPGAAREGAGRDRRALGRPAGRGVGPGLVRRATTRGRHPVRRALDAVRRGVSCCARCSRRTAARGRAYYPRPDLEFAPAAASGGIPLWIGSWGSRAGLRRVARPATAGSPPPTTPRRSASPRRARRLGARARGARARARTASRTRSRRCGPGSPRTAAEADRVLADVLAPLLRRDPDELARRSASDRGALRRAARALRRGRLRARLRLAARRRAAPARADRGRGGATDRRLAGQAPAPLELGRGRLLEVHRPDVDVTGALVGVDGDAGLRDRAVRSLSAAGIVPSPKRRLPVPSTTGKIHTRNSSMRSCRSSVWMRPGLPWTWISGPSSRLSAATYSATSPVISVELFHSTRSSVVEATCLRVLLRWSAIGPSS